MSTRYVWEKCGIAYELSEGQVVSNGGKHTRYVDDAPSYTSYIDYYTDVHVDSNGNISGTKIRTQTVNSISAEPSNGSYFHAYMSDGEDVFDYSPCFMKANNRTEVNYTKYSSGADSDYIRINVQYYIPLSAVSQKGALIATVSNAASSTYPRHNYTGQITSICAVIPSLIRRCSHVQ